MGVGGPQRQSATRLMSGLSTSSVQNLQVLQWPRSSLVMEEKSVRSATFFLLAIGCTRQNSYCLVCPCHNHLVNGSEELLAIWIRAIAPAEVKELRLTPSSFSGASAKHGVLAGLNGHEKGVDVRNVAHPILPKSSARESKP